MHDEAKTAQRMDSVRQTWDHGRWARVRRVSFDYMTRLIFGELSEAASPVGRTCLELGSGTGRLSYLALQAGARHVTLVDASDRAMALSRALFAASDPTRYTLRQADVLTFDESAGFDIVFSSGLIEHFQGTDRAAIIRRHVELARRVCVIIHPTDTRYARWFNRLPVAVRLYGFQGCFGAAELAYCLEGLPGVSRVTHHRFHPFYTVPFLHNLAGANRLARFLWGPACGGLTLTRVELADPGGAGG